MGSLNTNKGLHPVNEDRNVISESEKRSSSVQRRPKGENRT
ncbi:hypothetical protein ACQKMN_16165 [Ureibacillus composti]